MSVIKFYNIFLTRNSLFRHFLAISLLFLSFASYADNVLDEFSSQSFSNNYGSANWTTDWLEINEADGASSGDIRVNSNALGIRGSDSVKGAQREADLSAATSATLNIDYRRIDLDQGNDTVTVEVSDDGGTSWNLLDTIRGPGDDASYQSESYDITAYISNNTRVRFISSSSLDDCGFSFGYTFCFGDSDIVYFDNIEIDYTLPFINHFAISHDGTGDNCLPEEITISKHTAAHAVDTSYTGTITLSTSTGNGDWSKTATATDAEGTLIQGAADSGSATYSFIAADNGSIKLNLSNSNIETLNINITDGTDSDYVTEDSDLVFLI